MMAAHRIGGVGPTILYMLEYIDDEAHTSRFVLEAVTGDGPGSVRWLDDDGQWVSLNDRDIPDSVGVTVNRNTLYAGYAPNKQKLIDAFANYLGKIDPAREVGAVVLNWFASGRWTLPASALVQPTP